ncbi:MAG TPA: helix-turn-helix domain-containing protein [Dehalococcoidia bacterium]|nr:helix-turn-helix domain-containing protein [Dehalococcoidia bacterium]
MIKNKQSSNMLTVREVSEILHVHTNTLRRWSDLGILKAYRIGPRGDRRFKQEDIDTLLLHETKNATQNKSEFDKSTSTERISEYAMSR